MLNLSISICIIILLLIVPGALARKAYSSVRLSDYHKKASSLSEIVLTIALSILIQFIGIMFIELIDLMFKCKYTIDFKSILSLLSYSNTSKPDVLLNLEAHFKKIILYQLILYALCILVSRWILNFVINRKYDQKYPFLRFDNEWHYILTGRLVNPNQEVLKYANILMDIDDTSYIIYSGIIKDYSLNKDGELNIIELFKVKRKIISKDSPHRPLEDTFRVHSFFIPYANIRNFSITYIDIESDEIPKKEGFLSKLLNYGRFTLILLEILFLIYIIVSLTKYYYTRQI